MRIRAAPSAPSHSALGPLHISCRNPVGGARLNRSMMDAFGNPASRPMPATSLDDEAAGARCGYRVSAPEPARLERGITGKVGVNARPNM